MNNLDILVQNYFELTRTKFLTEFFIIITKFYDFSPLFFVILGLVIIFVYFRKGYKSTLLLILSSLVTVVVVLVLKKLFNVSRPMDGVIYANGGSFPSYHATMSTVNFIILNYVFLDHKYSKKLFIPLSFVAVFLVSLSRLYLGVHWLSDVLFGIVLGVVISYIVIKLSKK